MALPTATRRPVQDVKVFGVQRRATSERTKRPWIVRWAVDGPQRSRSFRARVEAERFRSLLIEAQRRGEPFDVGTGEPASWQPLPGDQPFHQWARRWLAEQWAEWQPRTRRSAVEALTRVVPLVVDPSAASAPAGLRSHLVRTLEPGAAVDDGPCERWLDQHGLPLSALRRDVLAAVDVRLGVGDRGQPLAPSTAARFRKVGRACVGRAAELQIIPFDPWPPAVAGRRRRKAAKVRRGVDVRRLPDPDTMARAIDAIATHQPGSRTYQLMTAVAYYAGLRPSEVVMLRPRALQLPAAGWGRLDVVEADIAFDESGEPKTGPRSVPIPPVLVERLRAWVAERGIGPDELLFRTRSGRRPTHSNWARAWQRALRSIGQPSLRVYDCRHAAATTWLRAGAPLGEVARRLGHGVDTLVSTYVGALVGDEALANDRIDAVLGAA
ncbi:MAG: tyrosine-type recombinase/integrase [Acidimicrobiales bacterium]